jgi:hypothetical protein
MSSREIRASMPPTSRIRYTGERVAYAEHLLPANQEIPLGVAIEVPERGVGLSERQYEGVCKLLDLVAANSSEVYGILCGKGQVCAPRCAPNIEGPGLSVTLPTRVEGPPMPAAPEWILQQEKPFDYMRAENARAAGRPASDR